MDQSPKEIPEHLKAEFQTQMRHLLSHIPKFLSNFPPIVQKLLRFLGTSFKKFLSRDMDQSPKEIPEHLKAEFHTSIHHYPPYILKISLQ